MFVVDQNFPKHCQIGPHWKPWSKYEEISVNSLELVTGSNSILSTANMA
jgi:hypothetical protein